MKDLTMIRKGLYEAKCLLEDRVPARYRGFAVDAVEEAIEVLNSDTPFVWHGFRDDTMPEDDRRLLVWLDYQHCGFPIVCSYKDGKVKFDDADGRVALPVTPKCGNLVRALWAYIPTPAGETPPDPLACSFPGERNADSDLMKVGDGADGCTV